MEEYEFKVSGEFPCEIPFGICTGSEFKKEMISEERFLFVLILPEDAIPKIPNSPYVSVYLWGKDLQRFTKRNPHSTVNVVEKDFTPEMLKEWLINSMGEGGITNA